MRPALALNAPPVDGNAYTWSLFFVITFALKWKEALRIRSIPLPFHFYTLMLLFFRATSAIYVCDVPTMQVLGEVSCPQPTGPYTPL
jgi:hypothetical protein